MRCSSTARQKSGRWVESGGFGNPRFPLWTGIAGGVISVSPSTALSTVYCGLVAMALSCGYRSVPQIRCSSTVVV